MPRLQEESDYKSPARKLIKFFETSRNTWQAKARDSKRVMQRLKNRIRFLEASRARWQAKATRLEGQLTEMKAHEHAREAEWAALKNNNPLKG